MAENWKFLLANNVYAYPSANASDKGDINSEANISGISWNLIQKSFVIENSGTGSGVPLLVSVSTSDTFGISPGACIINGYYIKINAPITGGALGDFTSSFNETAFVTNFKNIVTTYYDWDSSKGRWVPKPGVIDPTPIPKLHVVFKLIKDTTGNLKGDVVEVTPNGTQSICKGVTWSVLTDDQVADLKNTDTPYIDLAYIIINYSNDNKITGINYIEIPESLYSYIDIDAICHGDVSFREYTQQVERIQDNIDQLNHDVTLLDTKVDDNYDALDERITQNANDISEVNGDLDDFKESFYIQLNEEESIVNPATVSSSAGIFSAGVLTSYTDHPKARINFTISTAKSMAYRNAITVDSLKANIRSVAGDFIEASQYVTGGYDYASGAYTLSAVKLNDYAVTVTIDKKSDTFITSAALNTPVVVEVNELHLTFSDV